MSGSGLEQRKCSQITGQSSLSSSGIEHLKLTGWLSYFYGKLITTAQQTLLVMSIAAGSCSGLAMPAI